MNVPEAPSYPLNAFYPDVANAVNEVYQHVKAPDALVGMAFLTTMSVACQGLIDVMLPNGLVRPTSMNVLMIADSGERKSAVDGLASEAIYAYDDRRIVEYKKAMAKYSLEMRVWKAVEAGIRRQITKAVQLQESTALFCEQLAAHELEKPTKPKLRRIMRHNATERAIMDALEGDGESIAFMSDEGEVLLKGGAMGQIGLRNKGWDGARILVLDRADTAVIARNPRVTMSIMVQAPVLQAFLEKRGNLIHGSGHWARYIVGWPATTQGSRFEWSSEIARVHLPIFHERVTELLEDYGRQIDSGELCRLIIEFSDSAKLRWIEMLNTTESMLAPWGELEHIKDFASKAMEIVGRIAAILHGFSKKEGKITAETLERALQIVKWHLWEYKRIFSPNGGTPQDQVDAQSLESYLQVQYWDKGFPIAPRNEVLRSGPVRPEGRFSAALDILQRLGRVYTQVGAKRKRYIGRGAF
jgi:hypothetical protein